MTVNHMRRSLQSYGKWFNSFGQQLESHVNLYAETGMNATSAAMQDTTSKFCAKRAFIEKAYHQLTRKDPTREAEYETENKALLNRCNTVLETCDKATWAQKKSAPTVKQGEDDKRDRTVRIQPELRPDELSHKAMLIELKDWMVEFSAYYFGSNMQYDDLRSQQRLFLLYLDKDLKGQIQHDYGDNTPVLTPPANALGIVSRDGLSFRRCICAHLAHEFGDADWLDVALFVT